MTATNVLERRPPRSVGAAAGRQVGDPRISGRLRILRRSTRRHRVRWPCSPRTRSFWSIWTSVASRQPNTFAGGAALAPVFDELNTYLTTMHFNGQSTVVLDGESRVGGDLLPGASPTRPMGSARSLMVAAIRYLDSFIKRDGSWFFSRRKLMVDWTETRYRLGT